MNKVVFVLGSLLILVMGIMIGRTTNKDHSEFVGNSYRYLNGYRIDLPEEISQLSQRADDSFERGDNLYGVIDPVQKTIHITFDNTNYDTVFHEYQMDVDTTGFHIFDKHRVVGSGKWDNKSQLDSIIFKDNQ